MNPQSSVYLQIVGTATGDSFPSILLVSDRQRYLFNCGEGLQRFCAEHRIRLTKVRHVFFTRLNWERLGGLPGLGLTLREAQGSSAGATAIPTTAASEGMTLHGPKPLTDFVKATKHFLYKGIAYYCNKEFADEDELFALAGAGWCTPSFKDDLLSLWPIVTVDGLATTTVAEADSDNNGDKAGKRKQYSDYAISYIGKLADVRGKFLPNRAKKLGVPMGPACALLTRGQSITLKDGTKINPSDCMQPPSPGPVFFIIECPSENHWSQLASSKVLARWYTAGDGNEKNTVTQAVVAVHITPQYVFSSSEYQDWISRFGSSCQHIVINEQMCPQRFVYLRQSETQARLHALDPAVFPLPAQRLSSSSPQLEAFLPENVTAADLLLKFYFRPDKLRGFNREDLLPFVNLQQICDEAKTRATAAGLDLGDDEFHPAATAASASTTSEEVTSRWNHEVELTFTGTASSVPSKYRNVSGILLQFSKESAMMMDCGEGTFGQLTRAFGRHLHSVLTSIQCIFISHIHADHHLGLIQILMERQKLNPPNRVLVIGPRLLQRWLVEYAQACHPVSFDFLYNGDVLRSDHEHTQKLTRLLGVRELFCVPVIHCRDAFGLVFQHVDGWKMVYSGDTRPCSALIEAGANASVVIHEATHEDELQHEAISKKHWFVFLGLFLAEGERRW